MSQDYIDSHQDAQGNALHLAQDGLSYQLWSAYYQTWMAYDSTIHSLFPHGAFTSAKDAYDLWAAQQAPHSDEVQAFMDNCAKASEAAIAVGTKVLTGALGVHAAAEVVELVAELAVPLALLTGVGLAADLTVIRAAITAEHIAEAILTEAARVVWIGVDLAALRTDAAAANQIPVSAQSVLTAAQHEVGQLTEAWHRVVSALSSSL